MKLLSALIMGGKVRAVGAAPTDSAETALDDADAHARAGDADVVLYIGGPPNPERECPATSQFGKALHETFTGAEMDVDFDSEDCDCRQWAFQFLQPVRKPPSVSTTTTTTTTTTTPSIPDYDVTTILPTVQDYVSNYDEKDYGGYDEAHYHDEHDFDGYDDDSVYDGYEDRQYNDDQEDYQHNQLYEDYGDVTTEQYAREILTEQYSLLPTTSDFLVSQEIPDDSSTVRYKRKPLLPYNPVHPEVKDQSQHPQQLQTCQRRGESDKVWLIVTIIVTSFGLLTVLVGTIVLILSVRKSAAVVATNVVVLRKHEFLMPSGILLLFVSTALMAAETGSDLPTVEMCILKRFLPGMGYTLALVGTLLQVCYNLDQNVYIVNPKNAMSVGNSSKDTGHFLVGLCMAGVEVIVLVAWLLVEPPNLVTLDDRCQVCRSQMDFRKAAAYGLTWPLMIGALVCVYSGLSCVRWKIRQSGSTAKCNMAAVAVFTAHWLVQVVAAGGGGGTATLRHLVGHMASSLALLVLVFTHRVVARIRRLITHDQEQMSKELAMTGNSWLPDHHAANGGGLSLTGVPSARMMAARHAILQDMPSSLPDGGEGEEEEVVVRPTNGSLSMRATSNNILAEKFLHSHVNRSYTNTYSSCGSFKLPSVIAMPESSAWQQICRWQMMDAEKVAEEEEVEKNTEVNDTTPAGAEAATGPASSGSRAQSSAGTESSTAETGGTGADDDDDDPDADEVAIYARVRPTRTTSSAVVVQDVDTVSYRSMASTAVTNHLGQTDRDTKIITLSSLTMDENNE